MAPASAGCSTAPTRRCTGRKPPAPVWSSPTCRRTNPSRTGPPPGCGTAAHRPARRTHRITGCLLEADADAATHGFHGPPVLLLLHDRPLTPAGPGRQRQIRAVAFTLHPH